MLIGYIRVSSIDQNESRQIYSLKEYGAQKLYVDKSSGKNMNRPELKTMLNFIREGDTVVVNSISRFARNTNDLLQLVETLKNKDVKFISLKENIDTETPAGKFMLTIFGAVAQLEREYINDRQKEGIAMAKRTGKHLGRPKALMPDNFEKTYKKWKDKEIKAVQAMKVLNMKKTTFYKLVKEYEKKNN